jgi:carbamoylphosphate synthase large subunit
MMADLGLATPAGQSTDSLSDAAAIAETIGYPVFMRAADPGWSAATRHCL